MQAVEGVNLSLNEGEVLCLVGESGSGKSVTALSILGIVDGLPGIVQGEIWFQGENLLEGLSAYSHVERRDGTVSISKDTRGWLRHHSRILRRVRGKSIAMVFQDPASSLNPYMTLGGQLEEVLQTAHPEKTGRDLKRLSIELLERVRIPEPAKTVDAFSFELSGGMSQRAMLALSLASRPRLLIADEPTTALDARVQLEILMLLDELRRATGVAVLLITHDLAIAANFSDAIAVMYRGRVVECGPRDQILGAPDVHPYTRLLLDSASPSAAHGSLDRRLTGEPVESPALEQGCRFHSRCLPRDRAPEIAGLCRTREPDDTWLTGAHVLRCWKYQPLPHIT